MNIMRLLLGFGLCVGLAWNGWAQSGRDGIGSTVYDGGVTFRTWAPNATNVAVAGSFNGWGRTAMTRDATGGTWSVDEPRAKAGDEYKFVVNGRYRKDPVARRVVNSAGNSIVYNPNAFDWGDAGEFIPYHNDMVIYEMHVGSFNAESWLPSTFDKCIEKIPYLKALGISAVEVMPVMEYPGDRSWGYNPSDLYAVEASLGGPDGFKRFVKACHEAGIAVIVDVVHNHYGPSDLEMWQYDGWSENGLGGIYFYNLYEKAHTDWGDTRPDFGREEVRAFIKGQIRMMLEEYKVDGFRWDSVFNILYYNNGGNKNAEGKLLLNEINTMMANEFPSALRISEDHAFDEEVNFQAQWDHGFLNDIRYLAGTAASDSERNMNTLADRMKNGSYSRVVYVESHDSCGDLNSKHRLPYDISSTDPAGYYAKKRALLANSIALLSVGMPMIFEGSEMHEWWSFSNNQALRWSHTNTYAGIVQAYTDLIHLRRNMAGVSAGFKNPGGISTPHVNNTGKVLGLYRWDQSLVRDGLVVMINCSATEYTQYTMSFPSDGTWYCLYNSDSKAYDGDFGGIGPTINGTVTASGGNATLALGAYSVQIYSKSHLPLSSSVTFDPVAPDACDITLTITYGSNDGPLAGEAEIYTYIGRNNWKDIVPLPMTPDENGYWTAEYVIPEDTYQLDLSFHNGDATVWDNNGGNNWTLPVANCGDLPAEVTLSPEIPRGCVPVEITYESNGGLLRDATNLVLQIGRNGWQNVSRLSLDNYESDRWRATYTIPDDTYQIDFVFNGQEEGETVWDNNNGKDWHVIVIDCVSAEKPSITITSPGPNTSVFNEVTQISLAGTSHLLSGELIWTNTLTHRTGVISVASIWDIAGIPLGEGVNLIRVTGTNSAVNPNDGAWDSPTNDAYTATGTWRSGQNGGEKLQPWVLNTSGTASASLTPVTNSFLRLSPPVWTLSADGGYGEAIRPFSAALQPGDVFSFTFQNGGVDGSDSSIGICFENRFGQRLTELYFLGGSTNYIINGDQAISTGISWGRSPKVCTLEMLDTLTAKITINGEPFTSQFSADTSESLIARFRYWNANAGGGDDRKLYIGDVQLRGDPLPILPYSAEVAVTRPLGIYREILGMTRMSDGNYFLTLNSSRDISNQIYSADAVLEDGHWDWHLLSSDSYSLSNNAIFIYPDELAPLNVLSVGKPGDMP